MLQTGAHRAHVRQQRSGSLVLALALASSLIFLAIGAYFVVKPGDHRIDFPPADWGVAPPNWID